MSDRFGQIPRLIVNKGEFSVGCAAFVDIEAGCAAATRELTWEGEGGVSGSTTGGAAARGFTSCARRRWWVQPICSGRTDGQEGEDYERQQQNKETTSEA